MKLITRDTDYALRALCFLAKNPKVKASVTDLVRELKIPRPFLRKILQALTKKNILISYKGFGGGFVSAKPLSDIYLLDLIKIFQGPLYLNECIFKKLKCPNTKTCLLRKKINNIEKYVLKELEEISLASLV